MGYSFKRDGGRVVTLFDRRDLKPAFDEEPRPSEQTVPDTVYFTLDDGTLLSVGTATDIIIGRTARADDSPVNVDLEPHDGHDKGVSRHHAMMRCVKDYLMLCDLDSINGTFINEKRAMPLKRYALVDGDTIRVGRLEMTLHYSRPQR